MDVRPRRLRLACRPRSEQVRRSLPFALPCEKLLLPFLWDRELLRYAASCRACHASAHRNGRLELSLVARLPRNLSQKDARKFAEKLDLASLCSIDSSMAGNWPHALQKQDASMKSMGCLMVGMAQQAVRARALRSGALPLLSNLQTVNLPMEGVHWPGKPLEALVAIMLWEAPRIRELNLKGCRLRPAFLKKALQEHPLGRSQGWLPTETLASLEDEKILKILCCNSPEDATIVGELARGLTRAKELTIFACQMQASADAVKMLQAFMDGYFTDLPLRPPAVERLVLNLLSVCGAGPLLAQLMNALPALQSLRVGRGKSDRLFGTLDTGVLMMLAHSAQEAVSRLTRIKFEGARAADPLSLAPLLSNATNLRHLDLSYSEFGDSEAQLWAAAKVGPLPLQCLGFRHCRLRAPAGAAALARILNHLGHVEQLHVQANRWRVESHRAFAEQLAPGAAQNLCVLEAGYNPGDLQVPLAIVASRMPEELMESELRRPREVPDVEMQGGSDTEGARGMPSSMVLCSERLHFLSHFGAGLWMAAVLTRLRGLQELRLENLPVGVVALQVLRRRLRIPLERLELLVLGRGCTGLKEKQAGQELACALTKMSPRLQRLNLAGSDATPVMLLGMVQAFSSTSMPGLDGTQAEPLPRLDQLNWIELDEAPTGTDFSLVQAFLSSLGCPNLKGIRQVAPQDP